jgi:hypothetical protein
MAGRLSAVDPTVRETFGQVLSKAVGPRRGEPLSVVETVDAALVVGGLGLVAAVLGGLRLRRSRS